MTTMYDVMTETGIRYQITWPDLTWLLEKKTDL